MMDSYVTMRSDPASPRAKPWIVAAILLILNWAAPGQLQLPRILDTNDPTPGVSSGERASRPGNLPRIQARIVTSDASLPKAAQRLNSGGKPLAIIPAISAVAVWEGITPTSSAAVAAPLPTAARAFDPRAPPRLMA